MTEDKDIESMRLIMKASQDIMEHFVGLSTAEVLMTMSVIHAFLDHKYTPSWRADASTCDSASKALVSGLITRYREEKQP